METLVSEAFERDHRDSASPHGLVWSTFHELLHVIVFVYTLYGMIKTPAKLSRVSGLFRWLTKLLIAHDWYLSLKFGLIAFIMYVHNSKLEARGIQLASLNCSLANFELVARASTSAAGTDSAPLGVQSDGRDEARANSAPHDTIDSTLAHLSGATNQLDRILHFDYMPLFNWLLDTFGGPFKLLGNRATLMYGFYSVAIYAMLAIFPLELLFFVHFDYNFVRFALNDPGCMADLDERLRRHIARLNSWSRNGTNSLQTRAVKMSLSQRDLRASYTDDCHKVALHLLHTHRSHERQLPPGAAAIDSHCASAGAGLLETPHCAPPAAPPQLTLHASLWSSIRSLARAAPLTNRRRRPRPASHTTPLGVRHHLGRHRKRRCKSYLNSKIAQLELMAATDIRQLSTRLAINQSDQPNYQERVANINLAKFKPFVRSRAWLKASMIIFPIFMSFYFTMLVVVLSSIQRYAEDTLKEMEESCAPPTAGAANDLSANWSLLDHLMYYESFYTVFLLACAPSFYCSYYVGNIVELTVWLAEISQQLDLCIQVIGLHHERLNSEGGLRGALRALSQRPDVAEELKRLDGRMNDYGGLVQTFWQTRECLRQSRNALANSLMRLAGLCGPACRGQRVTMGGPERARAPTNRSFERVRLRELMAYKLLTKKATLLRATYINMCLFLDEHNETKYMISTILRRTIQIASGFAFMISITHSQFKTNYWQLFFLIIVTFSIFNMYLACAAYINSGINKMLVQIHSLIAASIRTGCEDAHLFEFWLRHVNSFGEDRDVMAYSFYGYKVTWSSILNVDSFISSLYFLTHEW